MKHPGGRKPKPPGERLSEEVKLRLTPGEMDELCRRSLRERRHLSVIVRDCLRASFCVPKTTTRAESA